MKPKAVTQETNQTQNRNVVNESRFPVTTILSATRYSNLCNEFDLMS